MTNHLGIDKLGTVKVLTIDRGTLWNQLLHRSIWGRSGREEAVGHIFREERLDVAPIQLQ